MRTDSYSDPVSLVEDAACRSLVSIHLASDPVLATILGSLVARTPSERLFLSQFDQWLKRPGVEGKVAVAWDNPTRPADIEFNMPVHACMGWTQKRKRGIWGRYFNLVFAFTDVHRRRQGFARRAITVLLDDARSMGAERLKSLAGSRYGFFLHRGMGHTMWGIDEHGHMVIDHPLTEVQKALTNIGRVVPEDHEDHREAIPNNVSTLLGRNAKIVDPRDAELVFALANMKTNRYRRCPQTWAEQNMPRHTEPAFDDGYEPCRPYVLMSLTSGPGMVTRWAENGSKLVKSPTSMEEASDRLKGLNCFEDTRAEHKSYYAATHDGRIVWRVYQCRSGL